METELLEDEIKLLSALMNEISKEWEILPVNGRTNRFEGYTLLYVLRERAKQRLSQLRNYDWLR